MASRDRIRQNEAFEEVVQQLEEELRGHAGLRALNAARRRKEIEKAIDSERNSVETFQHLLRSDPTLSGLFSQGYQLVTSVGPGEPSPFEGRQFPTFFRLVKEPHGGLVKHCPINRAVRVEFETDANNGYFSRTDSPGSITFEPPETCQHWQLWNGRLKATLRARPGTSVGDRIRVKATVSDVENDTKQGPFISKLIMSIEEPLERDTVSGGRKTKRRGTADGGKDQATRLAVPHIWEVTRDQWDSKDPPFTSSEALRVRQDAEGGYDFYLNVDNSFLLTELSRRGDVEKPLIKYWFKYGLALCALGLLQQVRSAESASPYSGNGMGDRDTSGADTTGTLDSLDFVNQAMPGLARVIIPVIRRLYKGSG